MLLVLCLVIVASLVTHVKYRQDNLHRMTWYTGTCSSNGHGLTIHVSFMVKRVLYEALDPLVL